MVSFLFFFQDINQIFSHILVKCTSASQRQNWYIYFYEIFFFTSYQFSKICKNLCNCLFLNRKMPTLTVLFSLYSLASSFPLAHYLCMASGWVKLLKLNDRHMYLKCSILVNKLSFRTLALGYRGSGMSVIKIKCIAFTRDNPNLFM